MLLTTLSIVAAVLAFAAAFVAIRTADSLARDRHRLGALRSELFGQQADLEKITARHMKLQGLFYALRAEVRAGGELDNVAAQEMTRGAPCPNWHKAQIDGPTSNAAGCGCDYCVGMRIQRHNVRAQLVPKSHKERLTAIKAGLTTNE